MAHNIIEQDHVMSTAFGWERYESGNLVRRDLHQCIFAVGERLFFLAQMNSQIQVGIGQKRVDAALDQQHGHDEW